MGYLYLSIALLAGVTKGGCGKKISKSVSTLNDGISVNVLRMLFCSILGIIMVLLNHSSFLSKFTTALPVYIFSAISMTLFSVCWMFAYKSEAYLYLNICTMLGTIITCICSYIFFHEPIRWNHWVGMILLLLSVYIMSLYNSNVSGKMTLSGVIILILGTLGSAFSDFSQKIYTKSVSSETSIFVFFTYAISFFVLFILKILLKKVPENRQEPVCTIYSKRNIVLSLIMSIALFLNSYFKTNAAIYLTSAEMYPFLQGSNLILSALMAHFVFGEQITKKCVFGMICAFCGLLVMNLIS